MIERSLHTQPYTKHSSQKCEYPEISLTYPPPIIERLHLIYPHDYVGEETDDENIGENIHVRTIVKNREISIKILVIEEKI